jgi:glycosyltransferase involved in cell wall biosynthesis
VSTWSLIICTLDRRAELLQALRCAVTQTLPPSEVIIVDASADWESTRVEAERVLAVAPGVRVVYVPSTRKSLPHQRNVGLGHSTGDVVFFLDDDSFMFPDCAEQVMRVYAADHERRIGGVTTMLADHPPALVAAPGLGPTAGTGAQAAGGPGLLSRAHALWNQDRLFIPYDGTYHGRGAGPTADVVDVEPVRLFHGCRMTFRADAVREVGGFEEALIGSAVGEDIDVSYRVSRKYALVMARRALLFHLQTVTSRPNRYRNTAHVILNGAALYCLNVDPHNRSTARVYGFALGRLALELLRDCAKLRGGLPSARGAFYALRKVPSIVGLSGDDLRERHLTLQSELFGKR